MAQEQVQLEFTEMQMLPQTQQMAATTSSQESTSCNNSYKYHKDIEARKAVVNCRVQKILRRKKKKLRHNLMHDPLKT